MDSKLQGAMFIVLGLGCMFWGFFGNDLRNDVDIPMTEAERADRTPPTKLSRAIYILFSVGLFIYGLLSYRRK